jgi:hypothetical protein
LPGVGGVSAVRRPSASKTVAGTPLSP